MMDEHAYYRSMSYDYGVGTSIWKDDTMVMAMNGTSCIIGVLSINGRVMHIPWSYIAINMS